MTQLFTHLWQLSPFVALMPLFFVGALLLNLVAGAERAQAWRSQRTSRDRTLTLLASVLVWIGVGLSIAAIGERYVEAGRAPFKTLYESLILLVACTGLIFSVIDLRYRHPLLAIPANLLLIGVCAYAAAKADVEIVDLPAALQSPWFVPHVVVYFLGYGAVAIAAVAAASYLILPRFTLRFWSIRGARMHRLDQIMHSLNVLGFILLTVGLLMGAWWAKAAWGDWWVWDPKENWALVSWLAYALYLHLRLLKGWTSKRMAVITLVGFATVIFTYLGMHLLPTAEMSEHVYQ